MALIKKFLEIRKKRKREEELEEEFWEKSLWDEDEFWKDGEEDEDTPEETEETEGGTETGKERWDWDSLIDERVFLKVSDPYQREKYIRSLVEQIKGASAELDKLSYEYNVVTAALKDMDELESLPEEEKDRMEEYARRLTQLEQETSRYEKKKVKISESQYYRMEQYEDSANEIYDEMKKAEVYREKVKDDLTRLDNEKAGYSYRRGEIKNGIANCKGMVTICLVAMVILYLILTVMHLGFSMEVSVGYLITTLAGAVFATMIYLKYTDEKRELYRVEKNRNRIILLQNTVKIRYVNNFNLLDYLYTKYHVKNAKEWKKLCHMYDEEKADRIQNEENEEDLKFYRSELLKILRCYQLSDARVWLRRPLALYDHKEMVEIRHEHIVRRQKLRARMDYNRKMAKEGEKAIRNFIQENPAYSKEILDMMERYS